MYIVYKTTNTKNGKIYVGVHNCSNAYYLGSGKYLLDAIKSYGVETFVRETLFEFSTAEQALQKEAEIVTEEFVQREDTYNLVVGGGLPPSGLGKNYPPRPDASKRMKENNPNKLEHVREKNRTTTVVRDKDGNCFRIKLDDPRYLNEEVTSINRGKVTVRDREGKIFSVYKNDTRYLNGELVHVSKGTKRSWTEEQKNKIYASRKNRTHSTEEKQKRREAMIGRKFTIVECPHCKKQGGESAMKRWHFGYCKEK